MIIDTGIPLSPELLRTYIGRYELVKGIFFTITLHKNQLMAHLTGQQTFPVYAKSKNEFFYNAVKATLVFYKNAEGKVTHLELHQNGAVQVANKVD